MAINPTINNNEKQISNEKFNEKKETKIIKKWIVNKM